MLQECHLSKDVVYNMKRGRMPTIDTISIIANYLDISIDFLIGNTNELMQPKKELIQEERLLTEICKLTPEKYKEAERFVEFLKTRQDFSQELSEGLTTNAMKPQSE